MAKFRVAGKRAATAASRTPTVGSTGLKSKTAGGSALSQRRAPSKTTSARAAIAASKVLADGRTSKVSKSAAGNALSQRSVLSSKKTGNVSRAAVRRAVRRH
jgi:hypothetical protein